MITPKRSVALALLLLILALSVACSEDAPPPIPTSQPTQIPATATPPPTEEPVASGTTFHVAGAESEVIYKFTEEFFGRAIETHATVTLPIGRTSQITGSVQLDLDQPVPTLVAGEVTVNLSSLTSDDQRRDRKLERQYLQTDTYPLATFVMRSIENFPAEYRTGESVAFQLVGDMLIRDVTQTVVFDVEAVLDEQSLSGSAVGTVRMTDYGFQPPKLVTFVIVQDPVDITLNFVAYK